MSSYDIILNIQRANVDASIGPEPFIHAPICRSGNTVCGSWNSLSSATVLHSAGIWLFGHFKQWHRNLCRTICSRLHWENQSKNFKYIYQLPIRYVVSCNSKESYGLCSHSTIQIEFSCHVRHFSRTKWNKFFDLLNYWLIARLLNQTRVKSLAHAPVIDAHPSDSQNLYLYSPT